MPLILMGLAVLLTYKMPQENIFQAVDFPDMALDIASLPLQDDRQLAVIEYSRVTKADPLD
ncbi:MAG: DUF3179 domain-containing protein [Chloroflexi bacterium AL-W]|nr:DUF3179 domain-containing protein [Chloroflexi bacterium AL-N1]NOK67172.1 DUF3179 domain-containing protein [Chloroflexi bacterium AL-N10]NOK75334.1 DUF3179 domain-containing protein [Chloroflexi bacterium AL-N5]NOK82122.1 DUF3179 domain-containing protein [Chloroflexi bacterium AL-W]NOK89967.1 DUF3179 domain-containing protein [Chloroflexi bacterium AL-N15]